MGSAAVLGLDPGTARCRTVHYTFSSDALSQMQDGTYTFSSDALSLVAERKEPLCSPGELWAPVHLRGL